MSQTSTTAAKYNNGNVEARTSQLRNAKIEENQIANLVKSQFESLSSDVQAKLNNTP